MRSITDLLAGLQTRVMRGSVINVTKLKRLPAEDQDMNKLIVRIQNLLVDPEGTGLDPKRFTRRQPVIIKNRLNGKSILRFVFGVGAKVPDFHGTDTIALDYEAMIGLGLRKKKWRLPVDLLVRPAWPWEVWWFYWNHPDYGTRLVMRLGMLGFLLTVAAFVLAL
jgi:hypothetical protein